jgi:hypothetical protein
VDFRYDYDRNPTDPEPAAHLQIRGSLIEPCLPPGRELQDVQFPTNRVGLEAVVRLLVESYGVPCTDWLSVWRGVLAETEQAFLRIAHRPASGPSTSLPLTPPSSAWAGERHHAHRQMVCHEHRPKLSQI